MGSGGGATNNNSNNNQNSNGDPFDYIIQKMNKMKSSVLKRNNVDELFSNIIDLKAIKQNAFTDNSDQNKNNNTNGNYSNNEVSLLNQKFCRGICCQVNDPGETTVIKRSIKKASIVTQTNTIVAYSIRRITQILLRKKQSRQTGSKNISPFRKNRLISQLRKEQLRGLVRCC